MTKTLPVIPEQEVVSMAKDLAREHGVNFCKFAYFLCLDIPTLSIEFDVADAADDAAFRKYLSFRWKDRASDQDNLKRIRDWLGEELREISENMRYYAIAVKNGWDVYKGEDYEGCTYWQWSEPDYTEHCESWADDEIPVCPQSARKVLVKLEEIA